MHRLTKILLPCAAILILGTVAGCGQSGGGPLSSLSPTRSLPTRSNQPGHLLEHRAVGGGDLARGVRTASERQRRGHGQQFQFPSGLGVDHHCPGRRGWAGIWIALARPAPRGGIGGLGPQVGRDRRLRARRRPL